MLDEYRAATKKEKRATGRRRRGQAQRVREQHPIWLIHSRHCKRPRDQVRGEAIHERSRFMDCSYVLRQGIGRALLSPLHGSAERWRWMIAQGWGRGLLDVGDQALIRGFVPHVRVSSGAAPRLRTGVDASIGHLQSSGVPLPRLHPRRCAMFVASLSVYASFVGVGSARWRGDRDGAGSHEAAREARSQIAP